MSTNRVLRHAASALADIASLRAVIRNGDNAGLTDFFDTRQRGYPIAQFLETTDAFREMRTRARAGVIEHFDLPSHCLPKWVKWLTSQGEQTPH